jgi:DNA polymerase III epsilon subunit-like protein
VTAPVVFLDLETTGLDASRHELYEVGLIEADGTEHVWWVKPNLETADPTALRIGRYYERRPSKHTPAEKVAQEFAKLTAGRHLVGAVPSFDAGFLDPFLRRHGQAPSWHYHLVDVEALAAGFLAGGPEGQREIARPPWDSSKLTAALGIVTADEDKHTALGDARWAKAIYEVVMGAA